MIACAVTLTDVTRTYGAALVLDRVSLHAPQSKILALLGPSGSGKSTILRLIAGLEPIDGGAIQLGDETASTPLRTQSAETRRVGVVFQEYALFPHLSAAANVGFGLDALSRTEREREARTWLKRVGLGERWDAFPHELSGGEQQRVALARALAARPRAILLDEPFSGLDPALRAELRETTLTAIAEAGATAIFVTHDAEEALLVADKLAILKSGRLVQEASPREAYERPVSLDAAAALGAVNVFAGRVESGRIVTPFGDIAAPGLAEGAAALAVVRTESIVLTDGAAARVIDRRPHGAHDLVRIEAQNVVWRALIPSRTPTGERAGVAFQDSGVFAFSSG
ncbi:MAG: ABC transporter ATP-binding protein [Hyphomonadaceae bacterium]